MTLAVAIRVVSRQCLPGSRVLAQTGVNRSPNRESEGTCGLFRHALWLTSALQALTLNWEEVDGGKRWMVMAEQGVGGDGVVVGGLDREWCCCCCR